MIVQAISLLDELDKEINTYAMRLREWYGWHFPELGKIIVENLPYAKVAKKMGLRTNAAEMDFSDIVPEETEDEMKQAAQISMGTEISDEDVHNIRLLCEQVITLSEYRGTLFEYLKNRMTAIAPNLTVMVGELVGARLIAHAGSLLSLAKYPASTVQILGAEKALFRALKTKHATPKYGLIYHASVVGQANPKHKGKISRSLASKCSLAIRVDALGDTDEGASVGETGRLAVEARLRRLEGKTDFAVSKLSFTNQAKYAPSVSPGKAYNTATDMVMTDLPSGKVENAKLEDVNGGGNGYVKEEEEDVKKEDVEEDSETERKRLKKEKKARKKQLKLEAAEREAAEARQAVEAQQASETPSKKKKKKRKSMGDTADEAAEAGGSEKKKSKKKKRRKSEGES